MAASRRACNIARAGSRLDSSASISALMAAVRPSSICTCSMSNAICCWQRLMASAHACELAINRCQQQIAFDIEQVQMLEGRTAAIKAEIEALESRREPARAMLQARREAAIEATAERERAAAALFADSSAYQAAHRHIEGLEA